MGYYRLTRQLKIHFGEKGHVLCMPKTSDNYLRPQLTTDKDKVTCNKCRKLLEKQGGVVCQS